MLLSAIRQQLLDLLNSVQPENRYKVVVVDKRAKQIIDLCCKKADLLNQQVANVLILDEPRPSESYLDCVYIVEQSSFNLSCIQTDFIRAPKRYNAAHVFLIPRLGASTTELTRFQNSSIAPNLKRVDKCPISWLALEERVYSLGIVHSNLVFYNQHCKNLVLELVDQTGRQLAHLSEALKINPYVRFSARWQVTRNNAFPALIARAAAQHIADARQRYMTPQLELENRPTILVLDRTLDLTAPLRHEFGFQSMALDVLGDQFQPPSTLKHFKSQNLETEGDLSETDSIWVDLRRKHIVVVTEQLTRRIKELREANPHLADTTTDVTVHDVRNMLAGLPEFMKERESVSINLDIAMECMEAVEKYQLKELVELEQTLVLGLTTDLTKPFESKLADSLVVILASKALSKEFKMRALTIYAAHRMGNLRQADWERLGKHAKLQDADISACQALQYLGWPMVYRGESAEKIPIPLISEHKEQPLLFSRVKPGLANICEEYISGKLDLKAYPYSGDAPDISQEALGTATSLRNPRQRATWAQNVAVSSSPSDSIDGTKRDAGNKSTQKQKKKLIVFIVGGLTPSESAVAYDLSESTSFSIIVGGHDLLTPKKYINFLSNIDTPREDLNLEEDQSAPPVPEFLRASDRQNKQQLAAKQLESEQQISNQPKINPNFGQPSNQQQNPYSQTQADSYGQPYNSQSVGQSLDASGLIPAAKEKKNMKGKLKDAFKLKRH